jgi:hypothetical protein
MKRVISGILATVVLASTPVVGMAQEEKPETKEQVVEGFCEAHAKFAALVMKMRQAEMPITEVLTMVEKNFSENLQGITKHLVRTAYSKPLYSSKEYKERSVIEFSNATYLECYEHLMKLEMGE